MDEDAVTKAIRSFPKGSAGGPSGLRPQHVRDALTAGYGDELARQLTEMVNLLARGEAPPPSFSLTSAERRSRR